MNKQERDVLKELTEEPYINQRILAESCGYSLGIINRSLKQLRKEEYIDETIKLTEKARQEFQEKAPQNAIILAAGYGMRMVPINFDIPKGLLSINGEPLVERIIKQLHEVGIKKIYVVVGFMKEQYEYLIDEYGVELVVNSEYATKNNLHSLKKVLEHLSNSYVIPCDIWCAKNPFHGKELYSWYMVSNQVNDESEVRVNRKMELVKVSPSSGGNAMIGIAYILEKEAKTVREKIKRMVENTRFDESFWEAALYHKDRMILMANVIRASDVVEINTYEQLRDLDSDSNHLKTEAITCIGEALHVMPEEIVNIVVLKKGMTNRSFLFSCRDKKYIMRIPGEGTEQLINRSQEAAVYDVLVNREICDKVIYMNPQNGYKITEYFENARVCDPNNVSDLERCMRKLREFHESALKVKHEFDIFKQIMFYESLWEGKDSVYKDYKIIKKNIFSLKKYIDENIDRKVLSHIDAVPDNFLFFKDAEGKEEIRLIDWEYAGMQDPHIDIAMFCIYALYNKEQIDNLIDIYFEGKCEQKVRIKIYCYIAVCGLLWSNWCEYKRSLGIEFGEYSLRQYRYAKDYYRIVKKELEKS